MINEEYMDGFRKRSNIRIAVLELLLAFISGKKDVVKVTIEDIGANTDKYNVIRAMGDLGKALPIGVQFNDELTEHHWIVKQPTVGQIAAAINIARTDGNCTSWNPK